MFKSLFCFSNFHIFRLTSNNNTRLVRRLPRAFFLSYKRARRRLLPRPPYQRACNSFRFPNLKILEIQKYKKITFLDFKIWFGLKQKVPFHRTVYLSSFVCHTNGHTGGAAGMGPELHHPPPDPRQGLAGRPLKGGVRRRGEGNGTSKFKIKNTIKKREKMK